MLLLSCNDLSRGFDAGPLFEHLSFEVRAGERIGLVGPNGVGKTTLLRILAGLDQPDTGTVRLHAGARIGLLQQTPDLQPGRTLFDEAKRAFDELLAAHDEMIRTAEKLARAEDENERRALAARYDLLNEMLRHHDAYRLDHRVDEVLQGLGFTPEDYDRPVETFSGGQQNRLMLARMLLAAPDVMLLDEPSNHLDIDATTWLEEYLAAQPEAMIVVSHDRYFLNKVTNKTFELFNKRLTVWPGNFDDYQKQRKLRIEHQQKEWEAQQEYIRKQEEYIRRVHYGQLHKQAQSRKKALERIERIERPAVIEGPKMHFGTVDRSGDVVLRVENLSKSYDKPLFQGLTFDLERGGRLGILGPNGSGKTTLLRILLGEEQPDGGTVQIGHRVRFGYYDQHLRVLPDEQTVLHAVWPDHRTDLQEQDIRDLLGRFGLTGDQVWQRVGELSGGERSRAALARLVALGVNTLVLDEPTNHLDLWACEALEEALTAFDGTVIVVSHDRYFLNRVVTQLVALEGEGRCRVIPGNYDDYEHFRRLDQRRSGGSDAPERRESAPAVPTRPKRKRRFPYRKLEDIEAEILEVETQVREVERELASPDLYRDGDKVKETTARFEALKQRLEHLYEHWDEAVELN